MKKLLLVALLAMPAFAVTHKPVETNKPGDLNDQDILKVVPYEDTTTQNTFACQTERDAVEVIRAGSFGAYDQLKEVTVRLMSSGECNMLASGVRVKADAIFMEDNRQGTIFVVRVRYPNAIDGTPIYRWVHASTLKTSMGLQERWYRQLGY